MGRNAGDIAVSPLLRAHRGREQQVHHADHAVQRRPQLVRHVRQEQALSAVGLLGGKDRPLQVAGPLLHLVLKRVGESAKLSVPLQQRQTHALIGVRKTPDLVVVTIVDRVAEIAAGHRLAGMDQVLQPPQPAAQRDEQHASPERNRSQGDRERQPALLPLRLPGQVRRKTDHDFPDRRRCFAVRSRIGGFRFQPAAELLARHRVDHMFAKDAPVGVEGARAVSVPRRLVPHRDHQRFGRLAVGGDEQDVGIAQKAVGQTGNLRGVRHVHGQFAGSGDAQGDGIGRSSLSGFELIAHLEDACRRR